MSRPAVALLLLALGACVRAPEPPPPTPAEAPGRFEAEIARFEEADRGRPPARGVIFVGSSSFRLWPDLAADFPGVRVLNRGFGGSTLPEVIRYVPRVVLPHRPHLVVLYAGDNDLAEGRTPADVLADYRTFVRAVRDSLPSAKIAFVSIKPSPSRWALADSARRANALVRAETERDPLQYYVDVWNPMLGPGGYPRPDLYVADSLHMTPAGYAIWRQRLARVVR